MNMSLPQMNKGFTLLELMIALALGLIVSAIAIQLTLTAQKSVSTQQAMSNLQSDALFGLEAVVRDVRLANLNASDVVVNDTVTHGGVVLDGRNYTSKRTAAGLADLVLVDALSKGEVANTSNLQGVNSDQLVIQYRNMMEAQFDCEGQKIPVGSYIVQKYFVRKDTIQSASNDPNEPFALACKAFTYTGDEPAKIDLSGTGEIIIPRVDYFGVMLGVAQDKCAAADVADGVMSCFGYISIQDYQALTTKPQIVMIKVGMLVRSTNSIGANDLYDKDKIYNVLNVQAKLKDDVKNKMYMRNIVTQTIAIRNGFGIEKQQ
ncbi:MULTISPECIES: PilW family protein [Acinetobacter]|uniref:PilW family protein n=1 Tax=Acinetobacter TaxID=469 RepID=UPI000C241122|nr:MULTISPECIES: PilW family protein [Acinetobacter]MBU3846035.1 PilW family protein [Candidatus Acinetobacter avistercoris]MCP0911166.1 PilW family protein [Acinetobacter pseudolwoffii]PJI30253.1 prepilin-type cleavage/methylation domain-containing protein [Acinetobacter pseudolwoffii]